MPINPVIRIFSLFLPALAAAQTSRPVPVDNPYVHVVDSLDLPHSHGPMHKHNVNRVMVYLTKCDTRLAYADGKVDNQHWKAGDVAWSPAGGPHASENPNDTPCRIVEVELKPGEGRKEVAGGPLDPVALDPAHYKVLLENDQVRVLRASYGPHETGAMHEHTRDRVTVYLTASQVRVSGADGSTRMLSTESGQVGWGTVAKHQEYNTGDHPFEVIAVELKRR